MSQGAGTTHRTRWEARYADGPIPWDTGQTPPEVVAFWQSDRLPHTGLVLDIGCGPGTNVRFLAGLGMCALGFDIAYAPLQTGAQRMRAMAAEPAGRGWFVQADVTQLPIHAAGAAYILDLGCSHGLPPHVRQTYADAVVDNLAPGGYYHLYGFDYVFRPTAATEDRYMGYDDGEVMRLFAALETVEVVQAMPDPHPCHWYLLRKPVAAAVLD